VLHASGGEIRQRKPLVYQEVDGVRHEVAGSYKLKDRNTVGFQLADYDASRPLVIDPVLVYSTFLGSSTDDIGWDIDVDTSGNAYVIGHTQQLTFPSNFPTTAGAFDTTHNGDQDVFVTKLNPSGSALVYSTFIGGSNIDLARGIAIDTSGNAYLTGLTTSLDFPTTVGAFDTTHNGGFFDGFVTKLNPSGSALVYSTFLGGRLVDIGNGIALDTFGSVYITGQTTSSNFPTTAGAFDTTYNGGFDAFVVKLGINGLPATLTLNPPAATNPVDSQHCVTATVQDASGNPVSNVVVRFQVMGAINTTGSTTTDSNGDATFCYFGPPLPGADTITTFADTDNSNVQDPGEPSAVAMKTWVLPATTPLCAITNGGWIIAANDDRANFGGSAKANEIGETQGHEEYLDHGPAQGLNMHSINVQAIEIGRASCRERV